MNISEALKILNFSDVKNLPSMKQLQKQYHQQALVRHPDKHDNSKASTIDFQNLLNAYKLVGKAVEKAYPKDANIDEEELIARKMFQQFQFSSVKVNSQSITIKTEKKLHSAWLEVLTKNIGAPTHKSPQHGHKFTLNDKCDGSVIFLTLYQTGSLLIQAKQEHPLH